LSYSVDDLRKRGPEPAMVLLFDRLEKRATATYGEIARLLPTALKLRDTIIFPTHIGGVAGSLMDRIQAKVPSAPLINLLVVNQDTGLPGEGSYWYIDQTLGEQDGTFARVPATDQEKIIQDLWGQVFSYPDWHRVYEDVFGKQPPSASALGLERFTERDGKPAGWGGTAGGESPQHKKLKMHVRDNPAAVGIPKKTVKSSVTELKLLSGDCVDVSIATEKALYLFEVKSILSSDDDIKRGIYQCLKYRVVLAAQLERRPDDGTIVASLVVEKQPPTDLRGLAKRVGVRIHVLQVNV
jgi:hypothetical protein